MTGALEAITKMENEEHHLLKRTAVDDRRTSPASLVQEKGGRRRAIETVKSLTLKWVTQQRRVFVEAQMAALFRRE